MKFITFYYRNEGYLNYLVHRRDFVAVNDHIAFRCNVCLLLDASCSQLIFFAYNFVGGFIA